MFALFLQQRLVETRKKELASGLGGYRRRAKLPKEGHLFFQDTTRDVTSNHQHRLLAVNPPNIDQYDFTFRLGKTNLD